MEKFTKYLLFLFGVGILGVIMIIGVVYYFISIQSFPVEDSTPPHSNYEVSILGLSNYSTSENETILLIPVPMVDGKPIFNQGDELLHPYSATPISKIIVNNSHWESGIFGKHWVNCTVITPQYEPMNWSAEIVDTEYGKMIKLNTTDKNLKDVDFRTYSHFVCSDSILDRIGYSPVYPVIGNKTIANNTVTYTSYVYLSPDIRAESPVNNTITINIQFSGHPGTYKIGDEKCIASITGNLSEGERGFIPVTVKVRAEKT